MEMDQIHNLCAKDGPGLPGTERGADAARRVRETVKRRMIIYRPDQRRATPQQAKDAATLCRWLNETGGEQDGGSHILEPGQPAEKFEDAIIHLAESIETKHIMAVMGLETMSDGAARLWAAVTPKDPDWTGISPLWQRAQGAHAIVLTDAANVNQPRAVVLKNPNAAGLMPNYGDGDPAPESHLARSIEALLKHHGAATITWTDPRGRRYDPSGEWVEDYTWSGWHAPMDPADTQEPADWRLTGNLRHTWMIMHPRQGYALARIAAINAESAIEMSREARRKGNKDAALGAAEAAQLMARRAKTCVDDTRDIIRQGIPAPEPREVYAGIRRDIVRVMKEAWELPVRRRDGPHRWYADACHRLVRHRAAGNMAIVVDTGAVSDVGPFEHYINATTAQQVYAWPSDNIYEISEDYPIGEEPDPELARVVRQCEEDIHALWAQLLVPLQERAGLEISPKLRIFPALTERLTSTLVPLMSCDAGFEYAEIGPDEDLSSFTNMAVTTNERLERLEQGAGNGQPTKGSAGWTGFYWNDKRIFKLTTEAYPKNYPAGLAQSHIDIIEQRFAAMVPDDPSLPVNPVLQPFYHMLATMEAAANAEWHTINGDDIESVDDEARKLGLNTPERAGIFDSLTGDDPLLLNYLRSNSNLESLSPRRKERTKITLTPEAADRVRATALKAGFPNNAVDRIQSS